MGSPLQIVAARSGEVLSVRLGVEANRLAAEKTFQHLLPDREHLEHVATGEWGMQEEANRDSFSALGSCFVQHLRQEHQVIVMDPDEISIFDVGRQFLSKTLIDGLVSFPFFLSEANCIGLIMQQWPKRGVCPGSATVYEVWVLDDKSLT